MDPALEWACSIDPSARVEKIAELQRRKLLMENEIAHLRQDIGARVAWIKGAATKKRKATIRAAGRKSSSWYEGATRSISIVKTKPI